VGTEIPRVCVVPLSILNITEESLRFVADIDLAEWVGDSFRIVSVCNDR
jgi:hypothetical protein